MRVLVIGINYEPEPVGIGPYTTATAQALAAAGHQVEVLTGKPYYPAWRADPALLSAGRALLLENKLPPGDRRERGSQLPDVWWCLALTEAVPHAAWALVVLFLLFGGGLAGWRLARAIAAE